MKIRLGNEGDIEGWMRLVEKVKQDFPGMETEKALAEHRNTVLDFMRRGSAVCAEEEGKIAGALLFSEKDGALCFLAVDPQERRRHIAGRMVEYAHIHGTGEGRCRYDLPRGRAGGDRGQSVL